MIAVMLMLIATPFASFASASNTYASFEDYCSFEFNDDQGIAYTPNNIINYNPEYAIVEVDPGMYQLTFDCTGQVSSGDLEVAVEGRSQDGLTTMEPSTIVPVSTTTINMASTSVSVSIDATGAVGKIVRAFISIDAIDMNNNHIVLDGQIAIIPMVDTTNDSTPRISFWYGKVNQHNENGTWMTDSDGVSGGGTSAQWGSEGWADRKVEYCQKFWPNTVAVEMRDFVEFITFYTRGNNAAYDSYKPVYDCIQLEEGTVEDNMTGDNNTGDNGTIGDGNGTIGDDNNTGVDNPVCTATIELTRSDTHLTDYVVYPIRWEIYGYTGDGNLTESDYDRGVFLKNVSYNGEEFFTLDVTNFVNTLIVSGDQYVGFVFRQPDGSVANGGNYRSIDFGENSTLNVSDGNTEEVIISDVYGKTLGIGSNWVGSPFYMNYGNSRGIIEYNILGLAQKNCSVDNSTGDNGTIGGDNDSIGDDNNTNNGTTEENASISVMIDAVENSAIYTSVYIDELNIGNEYNLISRVTDYSGNGIYWTDSYNWEATSWDQNLMFNIHGLADGTYCLKSELYVVNQNASYATFVDEDEHCFVLGSNSTIESDNIVKSNDSSDDEEPEIEEPSVIESLVESIVDAIAEMIADIFSDSEKEEDSDVESEDVVSGMPVEE